MVGSSHLYSHFLKYFLSTYCGFGILLYVYTIATKRYQNTTIMKNLTLTETIQQVDTWIEDVQFDLTQDWNDDKELMSVQLQQLMIAKSNLELILKTGGQILDSSIQK